MLTDVRRPVIRKQQVLKIAKKKYQKVKALNGDTQLPWCVFRAMLLKGWFYVKYPNRRRHDSI